ncbi:MAG: hypothetical protein ACTSQN_17260 [Candidatus Heimdallarchaeota archaeon]
MTETVDAINEKPQSNRFHSIILGFDIANIILVFMAVFLVIATPFFLWSAAGMLQVLVDFGLFYSNFYPIWFIRNIIILIALLCICITFSFLSYYQSIGRISLPKSNWFFFLANFLLSSGILVLILLTKKFFLIFSSIENPGNRVYDSIAFFSTIIFVSLSLIITTSQFVLSFVKK